MFYGYGLEFLLPGETTSRAESRPQGRRPILVERSSGPAPVSTFVALSDDRATLSAEGTWVVEVLRHESRVVCTGPREVSLDEIEHPISAFVAAAYSRWLRGSAFHAAAFVVDGRAWILLGAAGSGKSTLAAEAATQGLAVLTDDLAVISTTGLVLPGVRVADLRPGAPVHLTTERHVRAVRRVDQPRSRIDLGPPPAPAPVGGFVQLTWGDQLSLEVLPAVDRLGALGDNEALGAGPATPTAFLDLAGHPFYRLTRPRSIARLGQCLDTITGAASR